MSFALEYLNRDLPTSMVAKHIAKMDQIIKDRKKLSDRIDRFHIDIDQRSEEEWAQLYRWNERWAELVDEEVAASRVFEESAAKWRAEQIERIAKKEEKQARKLYEELKIRFG